MRFSLRNQRIQNFLSRSLLLRSIQKIVMLRYMELWKRIYEDKILKDEWSILTTHGNRAFGKILWRSLAARAVAAFALKTECAARWQ
jgi:hypothetical protein